METALFELGVYSPIEEKDDLNPKTQLHNKVKEALEDLCLHQCTPWRNLSGSICRRLLQQQSQHYGCRTYIIQWYWYGSTQVRICYHARSMDLSKEPLVLPLGRSHKLNIHLKRSTLSPLREIIITNYREYLSILGSYLKY